MCSESLSYVGIAAIILTAAILVVYTTNFIINFHNLFEDVKDLKKNDELVLHVEGSVITEVNKRLIRLETDVNNLTIKKGKK